MQVHISERVEATQASYLWVELGSLHLRFQVFAENCKQSVDNDRVALSGGPAKCFQKFLCSSVSSGSPVQSGHFRSREEVGPIAGTLPSLSG